MDLQLDLRVLAHTIFDQRVVAHTIFEQTHPQGAHCLLLECGAAKESSTLYVSAVRPDREDPAVQAAGDRGGDQSTPAGPSEAGRL